MLSASAPRPQNTAQSHELTGPVLSGTSKTPASATQPKPFEQAAAAGGDQVKLAARAGKSQALPSISLGMPASLEATTETQTPKPTPADWGEITLADRQAAAKALQTLARDLKAQGRPGIEIWTRLTQAAVENYADKNCSAQRKSDFVMQDLAIAVVGKDAVKHLKSFESLFWVRNPDPLVQTFFKDWAALGIPPADDNWEAVGWAGDKLDKHKCADFRPEIRDGSENQIFHTLFYQFMGYVTQAPLTIEGGSMVHELRDEGTSSEDHNAFFVGVNVGMELRKQRDGKDPSGSLQDWSAMTQAAYGDQGGPQIKAGTASERAQAMHHKIDKLLNNKGLIWRAENGLIDAFKWLKRNVGDSQ